MIREAIAVHPTGGGRSARQWGIRRAPSARL